MGSVIAAAAAMPMILAAGGIGQTVLVILLVAVGLGAVIFVHELGHFAVAKMCGVKCEKFFIGFDIGGYKISRQWGETEYGIGILPLGGYVKMLGQDDNPANIAEQVEKSQAADEDIETKEIVGPGGEKYTVDARSYLAKSVPQRMAIISAGVIMNVIFAFIFAVIAYGLGVPYMPCMVSQTSPGAPAWEAGIRTGDEVVQLGETRDPSFSALMSGVTLGDMENGVPFTIRHQGSDAEKQILLKPHQQAGKGLARVGIYSPKSLRLAKQYPAVTDSPAALAEPAVEGDDEIVAVAGEPVEGYAQFVAQLMQHIDEPLEITLRRGGKPPKGQPLGPRSGGEELTVSIEPKPLVRLGMVMEIGKIMAVQDGSPAAEAGIEPGDFIDQIDERKIGGLPTDDAPFWDPVTLPEQLRRLADQNRDVQLAVRRAASSEGRQPTETLSIPLRKVDWIETSNALSDPLSAPALGIAYRVLNRIDAVLPGSPAEKAGLQGGDVVTKIEFILPKDYGKEPDQPPFEQDPIEFGEESSHNWPAFFEAMQWMPKGTVLKLTCQRGETTETVELTPVAEEGLFTPERGFRFQPIKRMRIAHSFGEQVQLGMKETVNSLGMVFRFLRKLGTQVPVTSLGGPITIAKVAGYSAFEGTGKLLVFLTMLSANLAVINFLPIPLLDGGHMVFLAWEGLRGKPASERFIVALHTVGFVFIISLMLFVLGLDFGLIPRNL